MKRAMIVAAITLMASSTYAADDFGSMTLKGGFSWEGGYIGVNGGYAGGKAKHPFSLDDGNSVFRGSLDVTSSGFAGGVQAGYNWQLNNGIVVGVEADLQGTDLKGSIDLSGLGQMGTKVQWFGSIRGRIGYTPIERLLVYATGGYAYGRVKTYVDLNDIGSDSISKTKSGWTIGAGTEYAIDNNWTFKSEYLYTDLGKMNLFDGTGGLSGSAKVNFHTVRAGINYKF